MPFYFLHKLVNNGKNADSANLCMVFSISLVFCLATIGVGVFRCGDFGCRTFCIFIVRRLNIECIFCAKETDCITVNGEAICEECILKNDHHVCTRCGKLTKSVTNDLCSYCQSEETVD